MCPFHACEYIYKAHRCVFVCAAQLYSNNMQNDSNDARVKLWPWLAPWWNFNETNEPSVYVVLANMKMRSNKSVFGIELAVLNYAELMIVLLKVDRDVTHHPLWLPSSYELKVIYSIYSWR